MDKKKSDIQATDQVTLTLKEGFVWTTQHSQLLLGAVAAFLIIGGGITAVGYFNQKSELKAQEDFFTIDKKYSEKKRKFEEALRAQAQKAAAPVASAKDKKASPVQILPEGITASGDLQKDYENLPAELEAVVKQHAGRSAATMSALRLAELYTDYKQSDKAVEVLSQVTTHGPKDLLSGLAINLKATLLADSEKCTEALTEWDKVLQVKSLSFLHGEAKLKSALCYEKMNNTEKAMAIYSELSAQTPDASIVDAETVKEAGQYLRLLKIKKNL